MKQGNQKLIPIQFLRYFNGVEECAEFQVVQFLRAVNASNLFSPNLLVASEIKGNLLYIKVYDIFLVFSSMYGFDIEMLDFCNFHNCVLDSLMLKIETNY